MYTDLRDKILQISTEYPFLYTKRMKFRYGFLRRNTILYAMQ